MTNKSLNSPSFSRFSRMAFGLRLKSQSASPSPRIRDQTKPNEDSDWYTPYNGPYEPPPDIYAPDKTPLRDSWGDPVVDGQLGIEEENPMLDDVELHNRYGRTWNPADERKGRPRARTQSSVSGRTVSSGTVDPGRVSIATGRRSTVSHAGVHLPVSSYISLAGGVGESPVPHPRSIRDAASSTKRKSLASLFTFNSSSRKTPSSPKTERQPTPSTPSRLSGQGRQSSALSKLPEIPHLPSDPLAAAEVLRNSAAAGDAEYYDTYYSTLINQPLNNHQNSHLPDSPSNISQKPSSPQSPPNSEPSSATHPYAYVFSNSIPPVAESPRSAPPPKTHFERNPVYHIYPENSRIVPPSQIVNTHSLTHTKSRLPAHTLSLKNSISSPDLRDNPRSKSLLPKGKDKWLSAETWCDALLFPRPRFKLKQDKDASELAQSGNVRIVSPPGSPVLGYFSHTSTTQPSMTSRVLAHSRSMVDINQPVAGSSTQPGITAHPPSDSLQIPSSPNQTSRAPRPRSWAKDDLALPSPVPSLARVLEEGQILEHQRKKWQAQAVNSFQNHRARSLSRTRNKSLTSKQPKRKDNSTIDFLAARGLLGDQNVIPITVVKPRRRTDSQTESRGSTVGQTSSHQHHTSLSKTLTKSSNKTHSRNQSTTESIGKAVQMVKNTANHLCAFDGEGISPAEERIASLEGALQNNATKVITFADPAQINVESPLPSRNGHSISPTPSGISESRMGIALTTPPVTEENFEPIRLPAHPYAQGGFSFYTPPPDFQSNARAEPVHTPGQLPQNQNLAPPSWHPYAKAGSSSRDSYQSEMKITPRVRSDSNVPPPQKMWAQWSSGVVQEILPTELQYSPYLPDRNSVVQDDNPVRSQVRNSSPIYDTAGVGEALAFAAMQRYSRDSGIGTSEEHTSAHVEYEAGSTNSTRYRKTTQYDVTRPLYLQKAVASSPLQTAITSTPTPPSEPGRQDSSDSADKQSSDSSPPMSPPPPLGNVDDLAAFHDLFYRPSSSRNYPSNSGNASAHNNGIPWDVTSVGQRGSGLTSIARQLTEEINETRDSLKQSISLRSHSSLSALRQSLYEARTPPADANMRFVFSDLPETASLNTNGERKNLQANILTFEPSIQIPEDVESSRASSPSRSPVDKEDESDELRVGQIESNITPPAVSGVSRASLTGQMSFAIGDVAEHLDAEDIPPLTAHLTTAHSSLQPPSAGLTRSSYMTSESSRMSGLSDFPDPPPQRLTPAHMSLLSSYFDNTITEKEIADVRAYGHVKPATRSRSGSVLTSRPEPQPTSRPPPGAYPERQRPETSFDGDQEIDELIASLSPDPRL
ncbi:hypothetical protein EV361DRAFT_814311 [Lentinula raphanica]|nr:hypothetical protein C8R42DRAFT_773929 [Lentinula raphanica]KAJ3829013.1 hypothetical protein F5880DRAFT_1525929 [Lentinula raphanica]KAJ3977721.1 hypothetical protein EV361DRAFT_814311 [Lentinula raphanica]